jgi:hypothetical protein
MYEDQGTREVRVGASLPSDENRNGWPPVTIANPAPEPAQEPLWSRQRDPCCRSLCRRPEGEFALMARDPDVQSLHQLAVLSPPDAPFRGVDEADVVIASPCSRGR